MNRERQDLRESQGDDPVVVACIVVKGIDPTHLFDLVKRAFSDFSHSEMKPVVLTTTPRETEADDLWLSHSAAAEYLGISISTLYKYACQQRIECRKVGGRLDYRRSELDRFKEDQIRPARCCQRRGIIASAHSSGK